MDKRSRGGLDHTDRGRVNKDGSCRDFIIALDGFSLTLLPLNNHSVSGIGMGQKVSSAGGGNLRGFSNRGGGSNDGDFRGDREVGDGDGEVSGRNSEPIDGVRDVVGGLKDTVGVNILVASSGDSEGILGLLLVGVDVLVAEAELAKLVLGVELAGGGGGNGDRDRHGHRGSHGVNRREGSGFNDRGGLDNRDGG